MKVLPLSRKRLDLCVAWTSVGDVKIVSLSPDLNKTEHFFLQLAEISDRLHYLVINIINLHVYLGGERKTRFSLKKIAYLRTYTSEVTCLNFSYIYPVSLISFGQKMSARALNGCHWRIDFKNKRKISETTFLVFLIRERES